MKDHQSQPVSLQNREQQINGLEETSPLDTLVSPVWWCLGMSMLGLFYAGLYFLMPSWAGLLLDPRFLFAILFGAVVLPALLIKAIHRIYQEWKPGKATK